MNQDYYSYISSEHRWFDLKLYDVWKYRDLILLFTKRNITIAYKQTILGPLWLLLNPFLTSIMYMVLFSDIAKLSTDGIPHFLFYFAGNAIWSYFSICLTSNANTFTMHAGLFGKVYFPRLVIPIANIFSAICRFGIQMSMVIILVIYYMIKGILSPNMLKWILVPALLIWLGILGLGIGIIISSLTTKYRDLQVLVSFGVQLWMYATPVVYPINTVGGMLKKVLLLNPATMPIELFRYIILGVGTIEIPYIMSSFAITVVVLFVGIVVFNKVERTFMDTV